MKRRAAAAVLLLACSGAAAAPRLDTVSVQVVGGNDVVISVSIERPTLLDLNCDAVIEPGDGSRIAVSWGMGDRSEEHTSELQSQSNLVCRLLLEKKKTTIYKHATNQSNDTARQQ